MKDGRTGQFLGWTGRGGERLLDIRGAVATETAAGAGAVHLLYTDGVLQFEVGEGVAERCRGRGVVRSLRTLHCGTGRGGAELEMFLSHGRTVGAAQPPAQGPPGAVGPGVGEADLVQAVPAGLEGADQLGRLVPQVFPGGGVTGPLVSLQPGGEAARLQGWGWCRGGSLLTGHQGVELEIVRSEGGLRPAGVSVESQAVDLWALSQEGDQLLVREAGQVDTIAGEELVTRPDPTVRYCRLLHQSFDGVIRLAQSKAQAAVHLGQDQAEHLLEHLGLLDLLGEGVNGIVLLVKLLGEGLKLLGEGVNGSILPSPKSQDCSNKGRERSTVLV